VERNAKKPEERHTTAGEDARARLFAPVDDSKLAFVDARTEAEKKAEELKEKTEKAARTPKLEERLPHRTLKLELRPPLTTPRSELKRPLMTLESSRSRS
jgi:hypothetical protein